MSTPVMPLEARSPGAVRDLLDLNPMVGEPKKGTKRLWTNKEVRIVQQHYPLGGLPACLDLLPGRTATSIYQRAALLGLISPRTPKGVPRQRWTATPQIDDVIRRCYQKEPTKGDVLRCARVVGRPKWWVSKRAVQLGLAVPRFKEPPWSAEEKEYLRSKSRMGVKALQAGLKRLGFKRTPAAIANQVKLLGCSLVDPDVYTATALGQLMGSDAHAVVAWIKKGWLVAKKRGAADDPKRDLYAIRRKDVRNFIIDNAAAVNIRKVDKFWFIDLLANRRED